jgi:hypothetical protein
MLGQRQVLGRAKIVEQTWRVATCLVVDRINDNAITHLLDTARRHDAWRITLQVIGKRHHDVLRPIVDGRIDGL